MDKKKAVLVIILALLLAFAVAILIKPKHMETIPTLNQEQEQVIEMNVSGIEENIEVVEDKNVKEKPEETTIKKVIVKPIDKTVSKAQNQAPVFERLQVKEEASKVEEASVSFEDPGIIDKHGTIIVTRDFKIKSPRKYSFKDFGVLAEPPVR